MRTAGCSRLRECEALRDGRLAPAERSSFERHVSVCAACAGELEAMEVLAARFRESGPVTDELHARRERARLLSAFEASRRAPVQPKAAKGSRRWFAPAAVAVAACVAFAVWVVRPAAPASSVVHADPTAVWSTRMQDGREQIRLERGSLLIHVDHLAGQPRLRVTLPDGELEDIGTIFTVSVQSGRTARVAVQEGSVVLRLHGQPPRTLGAGEVWTPNSEQPAAASGSAAQAGAVQAEQASAPPSNEVGRDVGRASSSSGKRRPMSPSPSESTAAPPQTATDSTAPAPDPARDFRDATRALRLGEHRRAASAFSEFVSRYPRDPRSEDAAYLRVLALQKDGTRDEVRSAAREYLQQHPKGLRRSEIARVLGEGERGPR